MDERGRGSREVHINRRRIERGREENVKRNANERGVEERNKNEV